jgi:hypothetical protein
MSKDFSPMPLYYMKCEYYSGMWGNEYCIKFKTTGSNEPETVLVNKEDVRPLTETKGLVKVIVKDFEESRALIEINDAGNHKRLRFYVYKKEIAENKRLIANILT